jgi:hypothetical protein
MSATIDLPASSAGVAFAFADDDQHTQLVLEIDHGGTFVARITAENYPTSFDVEWPLTPARAMRQDRLRQADGSAGVRATDASAKARWHPEIIVTIKP